MKLSKMFGLSVALIFCFLFVSSVSAMEMKIGTISVQKVIDASKVGQDARKVLEAKQLELQPKFKADQESLQAKAKEIEKKSSVWSDEVRATKERDYQKQMREYKLKVEDAQYELKNLEKKVLDPIFKELQVVITELGKKKALSMVFEKAKSGGLLYSDDSLDISEEAAKALDAKMTKK